MADEIKDKVREYVVDEYVEEGEDVEVKDDTAEAFDTVNAIAALVREYKDA